MLSFMGPYFRLRAWTVTAVALRYFNSKSRSKRRYQRPNYLESAMGIHIMTEFYKKYRSGICLSAYILAWLPRSLPPKLNIQALDGTCCRFIASCGLGPLGPAEDPIVLGIQNQGPHGSILGAADVRRLGQAATCIQQ